MATKLFVGGLSWDTTDSTLSAFFAQAGQVVSATVITDRMTGRSKGFGFVEMASEDDAKKGIALNGQVLDGRTIAVSEARPKEPRENNFGGGNRGGFGHDNRGGGGRGFSRDNRGGGGRRSW
jgi:RNA recognition motif-containing protein